MIESKSPQLDDRLETPKQLAARVGVSERQIRLLIQTRQLEHVIIGCRVHIPIGALCRCKKGNDMSRRNQGPRLHWLAKRKCFYITWTEHGRSRECSTGTADREQAESILADWLHRRGRRAGPSDP